MSEPDPDLEIRRPKLRGDGIRRLGTVRWWKSEKGYGRITADDGEVLFVHFSGIATEGYASLMEGDRVSFVTDTLVADHNRSVADDVRNEPSLTRSSSEASGHRPN
jgi:CspA family cold shock protein